MKLKNKFDKRNEQMYYYEKGMVMFSIIFWFDIIVAYMVVGILKFGDENIPYIIIFVSGLTGLLVNLFNALQKKLLGLYFWKLRIWHRVKNSKSKWWLIVRLDGNYSENKVSEFKEFLINNASEKWPTKIRHSSSHDLNFNIKDSLNFYVELTSGKHYNLPYDFLTIELSPIEIGYNDSIEKLNAEIVPLLNAFSQFLKPENQSFDFHIEFQKSNPFFALYINHLKPESIKDFHVYLHVEEYSSTQKADTVQIDKKNICITAQSIDALKELAKDFLLLSPKIKNLARE
jgi:hypothetical protein